MRQADLFAPEPQPNLFGEDAAPVAYRADPDKVRMKLNRILAEARTASILPWDSQQLRLYRTIVPQMSLWLPEEEAAQLRLDFEAEVSRLQAAE